MTQQEMNQLRDLLTKLQASDLVEYGSDIDRKISDVETFVERVQS